MKNMAEFIIIRGNQQSGKTTTTGLVYQELLKICDNRHEFDDKEVDRDSLKYDENGNTYDFKAVLTFKDKKIGIISAGDIASDVRVNLKAQIDRNIDIIICCARSRNVAGSTYKMIIDEFTKANNIALEIFTKFSVDKNEKYSIKKDTVDKIVSKVKDLIVK